MTISIILSVVFALPLLVYIPGHLICRLVLGPGMEKWDSELVERIFVRIITSVLLAGWLAFILAELGVFSLPLLSGILAVVSAMFVALIWRRSGNFLSLHGEARGPKWWEVVLLIELVAAVALFFHPAEMIRGDLDSGVYVNTAANIALNGGIISHDEELAELSVDEQRELLLTLQKDRFTFNQWRIPGFYVQDIESGSVLPQLYHLLPAWLAVGISTLGIQGGLYTMPFILLLGSAAVFLTARRLFGAGVGILGSLFLTVNSVQIWFARYPTSEGLNQLLFWAMLFAFALFIIEKRKGSALPARFFGVLAGFTLGQIMLVRPDFIFFVVPAIVYAVYLRFTRRFEQTHWYFFGPLALMGVHAALHLAFFTFPYTRDLYHHMIRYALETWPVWEVPVGAAIIILFVAFDRHPELFRRVEQRIVPLVGQLAWVAVGALLLWTVYAYLVRPGIVSLALLQDPGSIPGTLAAYIGAPVERGKEGIFVRLGWYLSPLGVALGVAGLALIIRRRLNTATLLFIVMAGVYLFIYTNETYTVQHYIYTMRRYIPVVIPVLSIGAAFALQELSTAKRLRPAGLFLSMGLTVGMLAFYGYTGRVIVPHVEYQGAVNQIETLAGNFRQGDVLLFSSSRDEPYVVLTPLKYVYGLDAFAVKPDQPNNDVLTRLVQRWETEGHRVFVIAGTNGGKVTLNNMELREVGQWRLDVPEFEQLFDQKPMNTYRSILNYGIYRPEPTGVAGGKAAQSVSIDIGGFDYKKLVYGFYESETKDGVTFRWTAAESVLRISEPVEAAKKLVIKAGAGPKERTEPAQVAVYVNDVKIGQVKVNGGSRSYEFTLPASITNIDRGSLIKIQSSSWTPAEAGLGYDTRALGIQLDKVTIE